MFFSEIHSREAFAQEKNFGGTDCRPDKSFGKVWLATCVIMHTNEEMKIDEP
jgi:hypothetical protein